MSTAESQSAATIAARPNDDARGSIVAGIVVCVAFFFGLGGWAALAPVSSAAVAGAVVKVEGNRRSVQHLEGGIVKELRVREGDRVEEGQVLVVLDDTNARAQVEIFSRQFVEARAQEARLAAERDKAPAPSFDADLLRQRTDPVLAKVIDQQVALFDSRRATLAGQIRLTRQRIAQNREQIVGIEGQLIAYRSQLESTRNENRGLRDLFKQGYVPRQRMLELERAESALEGQVAETAATIMRLRQQAEELELQVVQLQADRMAQVATDLRETQARSLELGSRLQAARETLKRTEIRTPYAGLVVGLAVFSVGGVVAPGEKIADIVPEREGLIVEATINVDDIKDIRPGMRAEVHLTSFRQRTIPIVHGDITHVSADRMTDQRSGAVYYLAHVRVDPRELEALPEVKLVAGMAAMVIIPIAPRSVLDYLLEPLSQVITRSFRER